MLIIIVMLFIRADHQGLANSIVNKYADLSRTRISDKDVQSKTTLNHSQYGVDVFYYVELMSCGLLWCY